MNKTDLQGEGSFRTRCTRAETRFEIDAHCRFWWTAESEQTRFGAGRTVDVSSRGILVVTPDLPPHGAVVMLEVDLPRIYGGDVDRGGVEELCGSTYLLLSAEGTVLRPHGEAQGFAAKISHSSFAANQRP